MNILTVLEAAIATSDKINSLNIAGNNFTVSELVKKLDDDDLTLLMLKSKLHETKTTRDQLNTV